jgi:hypothetical protein
LGLNRNKQLLKQVLVKINLQQNVHCPSRIHLTRSNHAPHAGCSSMLRRTYSRRDTKQDSNDTTIKMSQVESAAASHGKQGCTICSAAMPVPLPVAHDQGWMTVATIFFVNPSRAQNSPG